MGRLNHDQRAYVTGLIGEFSLVRDCSWPGHSSCVLHVRAGGRSYIIKTGERTNHHIGREIDAHGVWTKPLVHLDRTAPVVGWDATAKVLVVCYQPGELCAGTDHEFSPDFHHQAGRVLQAFHSEAQRVDDDYERRATDRALAWLDGPHRIAPDRVELARELLTAYVPEPACVVPTHGDWQPRNWLADGAWLRVIDFGRFAFRPASSDLCRLAQQQWMVDPRLEAAFLDGYGGDPRVEPRWGIELLREAIGTAAWAYQAGDADFEAHGQRSLARALVSRPQGPGRRGPA